PCNWTFRELLFGYEHAARSPDLREALAKPADLYFSNYVFTSPLLEHVPRSCKRVVETHDLLARQFALAERRAAPGDPLVEAREAWWLRLELELYRLFDAVAMIAPEELAFVQSQGITHAAYVPQMCPAGAGAVARGENARFDLLFVGSDAEINVQGITWFYRNVYVPYLWRHRVRWAVVGDVCQRFQVHDAYVTRLARVEGPTDD